MFKKTILTLLAFCVYFHTKAQTSYPENESPANIPIGVIYQSGPGSNNTLNWAYPYGTKLTINRGSYRNFEIMATSYPEGDLVLRQWDPNGQSWSSWRKVLIEDENGSVNFLTKNPDNPDAYTTLSWLNNVARIRVGGNGAGSGSGLDIQTTGDKSLMRLTGTGDIGIGTTTPEAKLDIKASGDGVKLLQFSTERAWAFMQEGSAQYSSLVLKDMSGSKHFKINAYDDTNAFLFSPSDGKSYFKGNMGIGTTDPGSFKLAVEGKIGAREVVVTTDSPWPDYVFNPEYKLTELSEIEEFIQDNHHLPNIPSAQEVKENGLSLGEMNTKLLEKVEELTLHLIEQNKQIKQLQAENKQQDKLIKELLK